MDDYRANWNRRSLDGLPGLRVARKDFGESLWLGDVSAQVRKHDGLKFVLVALLSSAGTVLALWGWGLLRLEQGGAKAWLVGLRA